MSEDELIATPIGFIEELLGLPKGYPWQHQTVTSFENIGWGKPIVQVTTLAPNGGGKTSWCEAGLSLWHLFVHAKGKCTYTTKDTKQLKEQFIPAVESVIHKLPGFTSKQTPYYIVENGQGGRLVGYVTDDPGRVEGFHGKPDEPLLSIIGEAKNVPRPIFDANDRCGYQGLLYSSSGGLMVGPFYESHTSLRHLFIAIKAGLKDCPHKSEEKIQMLIQKHGENHPIVRSSIYGEFMTQDDEDSFVISHANIVHAIESPPPFRSGHIIGFVDFAEGSAEHVLAVRDGNRTQIALAFREANKHAACARLIRGFKQAGLTPEQVWCDAADKEAAEILASLGWNIWRQNFGAKALNEEVYQSWSAEAWHETGIAIGKGEIQVPNDEILIAQLTSRKKTYTGRGKLGVEEKYDMRKRGIESPDRADAFCGANNVFTTGIEKFVPFEQSDHESEVSQRVLEDMGAFAGR